MLPRLESRLVLSASHGGAQQFTQALVVWEYGVGRIAVTAYFVREHRARIGGGTHLEKCCPVPFPHSISLSSYGTMAYTRPVQTVSFRVVARVIDTYQEDSRLARQSLEIATP